MQYTYLLSVFALLFSLTSAIPTALFIERAGTTPDTTSPSAAAASPSKSAAPTAPKSNSTSSTGACSQAVSALANGISANIADQNNELNTVTALGNVLAQNPLDTTLYAATQTSLLGFVTKGITIRENNQKIAPPGNAALAGLAVVAMAQMTELNLTMSLAVPATGIVDQAKANATVEMLKGDFAGGIKKNMENLMMVSLLLV